MPTNNKLDTEVVFEYMGKGCVVPKNVTSDRHLSVTEIGISVVHDCSILREIEFHEGLQKIGNFAFSGCRSLSSITIPSTVVEIGGYAFDNCRSLREVVLNEGLQKIGVEAFYGCTSLSSIKIPSTVTEVGGYAFCYCSSLREVVLHGVPREMGKNALDNCTSLERFTFPTISNRLDTLIQTGHWINIENEANEVQ